MTAIQFIVDFLAMGRRGRLSEEEDVQGIRAIGLEKLNWQQQLYFHLHYVEMSFINTRNPFPLYAIPTLSLNHPSINLGP